MRYLTIEQRERLEQQLKAEVKRLRGVVKNGPRLPNHNEETDDEAVADLETSLDLAELERASLELKDAVQALGRLHAPDYGLCAECGGEIPYARLQVNPAAMRCLVCQRGHERGTLQIARL
jgi:DnaK suppressor protein